MIRVKDYHHVALAVRDLTNCVRFYSGVLGLETIERPTFNFSGHWFKVGDSRQLHLMVMNEKRPETMRHFAIEVEDFQKMMEHLRLHQVTIVNGAGKRVDGSDYLFIKDPEGNLIEVTHH
jgi:catechol 2,3-dioxygenase-like lactoylglutathione lyase family enzyme